jgi:hypothetical protein
MLNAFARNDSMISRAMIQEVAETFDILPRVSRVEDHESPARVFPAASRAELWSLGNGDGNGNGNAQSTAPEPAEFVRIPSYPDDITYTERTPLAETTTPARSYSFDKFTTEKNPAVQSNGSDVFGRNNNGQSL